MLQWIRSIGARGLTWLALPIAVRWVRSQEGRILEEGRPLSDLERSDACDLGLSERLINELRVMPVKPVPMLADRWLPRMMPPAGMALGRGIYLDCDVCDGDPMRSRALLRHEMIHSRQYEQLGGIRPFLKRYLYECLAVGYANSPLEREAVAMR